MSIGNREEKINREEMLLLCESALSSYGAQASSILSVVSDRLQGEMSAGNIPNDEYSAVTRAEAAYVLYMVYSLKEMESPDFGIYNGDAMMWRYAAGTFEIRYPEKPEASMILAALYTKTTNGMLELYRLVETFETEGGWQVTLPEGSFVFKAFVWGETLSPYYQKIEL